MLPFRIPSTSSAISLQQQRIGPLGRRRVTRRAKPLLRRDALRARKLLRTRFGNVTTPSGAHRRRLGAFLSLGSRAELSLPAQRLALSPRRQPGRCWHYADPSQESGFWDVCPGGRRAKSSAPMDTEAPESTFMLAMYSAPRAAFAARQIKRARLRRGRGSAPPPARAKIKES